MASWRREYHTKEESPFWMDEYEKILMSYPKSERDSVLYDLLNGRNSERHGIKYHAFCVTSDVVSRVANEIS